MEEVYIYCDWSQHRWVRLGCDVGMVGGNIRSVCTAQVEHVDDSQFEDGKMSSVTKFSILNLEQTSCGSIFRKGRISDLDQYCGVCFEWSSDTTSLIKDFNGLLVWDSKLLAKLLETEMDHCSDLMDKQLVVVGHCLELGCNLIMNNCDNVSICIVFEVC